MSGSSPGEVDRFAADAVRNVAEFAHILRRFGEAVPGPDGDGTVALAETLDGHHQVLVDAVGRLRKLANLPSDAASLKEKIDGRSVIAELCHRVKVSEAWIAFSALEASDNDDELDRLVQAADAAQSGIFDEIAAYNGPLTIDDACSLISLGERLVNGELIHIEKVGIVFRTLRAGLLRGEHHRG